MPITTGSLETKQNPLKVELREVPFIVRTVLGQLGWGNFFFDLGLATADKRKQLKRAGLSRSLEHRIQVKWRASEDKTGVYVRVQVDDSDGNARTEELKDACLEVMKAIFSRADEIKAHGERERRTTYGSAKWAEQSDLDSVGYVNDAEAGMSFVLGLTDTGEQVALTPEDSVKHAVVGGPTGSGKTSRIIIPQMLKRWKSSAIVTEATAGDEPPDVYTKTSGFRKKMGHKIYRFDPDALDSHRINPVDQIKTIDESQLFTSLIIESTKKKDGGGGEDIWDTSERHLLNALLLHAAGEKANLAQVRAWLTSGQDGMKNELMRSKVEKAKSEYMAFYNVSTEGFRNGVISGVMMRLNLWVSPRIAALTEETDIDIDGLHHELFTLYLSVPAQKGYLKPLAVLVFNYILSQTEKDFDMPLFLCLDEFTNFGRIPDFANKTSIIRHRNISAMLGFQDFAQLEKVYGREDAGILWSQLGTRIFFKPNDLNTAKRISEMLGTETFHERVISSSGQIQEKEFGRPLMNPGEVLAMKTDRALVFTPQTSPIKLKTFTWQDFVENMSIPPPKREKLEVDERLIKICEEARRTPEWQAEWLKTDPVELKYLKEHYEDTKETKAKPAEINLNANSTSEPLPSEPDSADEESISPPQPIDSEQIKEENEPDDNYYGSGAII